MFNFNRLTIHKNIQGMTLIEVMVALVILSVGLLGLAGLQIHGLRGTSGANSRVQAVFIITDMAERMHANTTEVNTNLAYAAVALNANACGNAPTDCNTGACTTAQLAAHDNFEICRSMTDNLPPGATMTITCDAAAPCVANQPSTHTLTLSWNNVRDANLGAVAAQTVRLNILP